MSSRLSNSQIAIASLCQDPHIEGIYAEVDGTCRPVAFDRYRVSKILGTNRWEKFIVNTFPGYQLVIYSRPQIDHDLWNVDPLRNRLSDLFDIRIDGPLLIMDRQVDLVSSDIKSMWQHRKF